MEKFLKHRILPFIILVSILFTQVAVNFFHHHRESVSKGLSIDTPKEKCKVCSIDLFHDIFFEESYISFNTPTYDEVKEAPVLVFFKNPVFSSSGRAPPVLLI